MTSSTAPLRAPRLRMSRRAGQLLGRDSDRAARQSVYPITSARRGLRDDVASRTRRYLFSMGVRTGCFLGAVAAGGWLRWLLIVPAFFLPYLAVVFANGGRDRVEGLPVVPASNGGSSAPGRTGAQIDGDSP